MTKEFNKINWDDIMQNFSSFEGTIADFCRENNISPHQLCYRRKRLKKEDKSIFHAIPLNKEETINLIKNNTPIHETK